MDAIKAINGLVDSWWKFFDYCFNYNPASLVCEPFWTKLIAGFILFGALCVLVGGWMYFSFRRKYAAALRAQAERERIDEEGIREAVWNGDKAYQAHLPDAEILSRIRASVEERKREAASPPPNG